MILTTSQLKSILPHAGVLADIYIDLLNDTMEQYEINKTPKRIACFIAQVGHESGGLRYVEEIGSGSRYTDRADLGNTNPLAIKAAAARGFKTGPFYKGHGLIQLSGYINHLNCGTALGLDLVHWPELLMVPRHAAFSAGWFWDVHGLNSLSDNDLFEHQTRRINGGLNGFENRLMLKNKAMKVLS